MPTQKKRISVILTDEMNEYLTRIANRDERSVSSVAHVLLKRYIQELVAKEKTTELEGLN
jgi:hypothetical protein